MIDKYLDQIELLYGVEITDRESKEYNILKNYAKYNLQESLKFVRKIANFIGVGNKSKLDVLLLQIELSSRNPFWIKDFYYILCNEFKLFSNLSSYNIKSELFMVSLIDKFIRSAKTGDYIKMHLYINNLFNEMFELIKHSQLMEDRRNLDYIVFKNEHNIYTLNKCKHIVLNEIYTGTYYIETIGKWDNKTFDLNELDNKIGFDKALLRMCGDKYTCRI